VERLAQVVAKLRAGDGHPVRVLAAWWRDLFGEDVPYGRLGALARTAGGD
jgi:hypothetical protein